VHHHGYQSSLSARREFKDRRGRAARVIPSPNGDSFSVTALSIEQGVLQVWHPVSASQRPVMAATTTIRLPPKLRARIHALAKQSGRSAHSVILEAIERHADHEEQMRSLVKEAIEADEELERTREVYRADDVHAWVERLTHGTATDRPKLWRR
jgi:predicted transcriptional regulator